MPGLSFETSQAEIAWHKSVELAEIDRMEGKRHL